jgi:pimeloyl-ACP methyl ester carboxylesterase
MKNLRIYGTPPLNLAVIHGGPGAPGEMAPIARELFSLGGVLEPFQTALTIEAQIKEMADVLEEYGSIPIILIGFSWGAMLSFIFTAWYPQLVKKLILIGSGPYEEKHASNIMKIRMSRLGNNDMVSSIQLTKTLDNPSAKNRNEALCSFGKLMSKADTYDSLPHEDELLDCRYEVFKGVWEEASYLRRSGKLLELGSKIQCQVVAIHGDYDPHPFEGVRDPLSWVLRDFKLVLLKNCGHKPWIERQAKENFLRFLNRKSNNNECFVEIHFRDRLVF